MAPLVACATDSSAKPYTFIYTEVNPSLHEDIDDFLRLLVREGIASNLKAVPPPSDHADKFAWSFTFGRHPVSLALVIDSAEHGSGGNRLYPTWALTCSEMVITHDWAGDQQENLRLIWELLKSVRRTGASRAPLMMIENLEQHPYPVDLALFSPLAKTALPYGHRQLLKLPSGVTPGVELGTSLYGGGIVLSFADTWWKGVDDDSLISAFNFLLFNEFDNERLNTILGGPEPVLSPPILDWMAGFGTRSIEGEDVIKNRAIKETMVTNAPLLANYLPVTLRKRWACRMVMLWSLLELEASGAAVDDLMPSARFLRRAGDSGFPFPTRTMEQRYEEAKAEAHTTNFAHGRQRLDAAKDLRSIARMPAYRMVCSLCSIGLPIDGCGAQDTWRKAYLSARETLK